MIIIASLWGLLGGASRVKDDAASIGSPRRHGVDAGVGGELAELAHGLSGARLRGIVARAGAGGGKGGGDQQDQHPHDERRY